VLVGIPFALIAARYLSPRRPRGAATT